MAYAIAIKGKDQSRYSMLGSSGYLVSRRVHALFWQTRSEAEEVLAKLMANPLNVAEFDAKVRTF